MITPLFIPGPLLSTCSAAHRGGFCSGEGMRLPPRVGHLMQVPFLPLSPAVPSRVPQALEYMFPPYLITPMSLVRTTSLSLCTP